MQRKIYLLITQIIVISIPTKKQFINEILKFFFLQQTLVEHDSVHLAQGCSLSAVQWMIIVI